jgi:hypothetical protein
LASNIVPSAFFLETDCLIGGISCYNLAVIVYIISAIYPGEEFDLGSGGDIIIIICSLTSTVFGDHLPPAYNLEHDDPEAVDVRLLREKPVQEILRRKVPPAAD